MEILWPALSYGTQVHCFKQQHAKSCTESAHNVDEPLTVIHSFFLCSLADGWKTGRSAREDRCIFNLMKIHFPFVASIYPFFFVQPMCLSLSYFQLCAVLLLYNRV